MTDDELLALAKDILLHHYGIGDGHGRSVCWTCEHIAWPCPPVKLALAVQEQVLAR